MSRAQETGVCQLTDVKLETKRGLRKCILPIVIVVHCAFPNDVYPSIVSKLVNIEAA